MLLYILIFWAVLLALVFWRAVAFLAMFVLVIVGVPFAALALLMLVGQTLQEF